MKNYIKIYTVLLVAIAFATSCSDYKDKGNYSYEGINEVNFSGIEKQYVVVRSPDNQTPSLKITPKLSFTKDSKEYSYKWELFKTGVVLNGESAIKKLSTKVVSTQKNLDIPIDADLGAYYIYYTVKDISSGIEFQTHSNLSVENTISEGWLVLSQVGTNSRLGMVPFILGKPDKTVKDILKFQKSKLKLKGQPKFIYIYIPKSLFLDVTDNYIYITTSGNGTHKISRNDFGWNENMNIAKTYDFKYGDTKTDWKGVDNISMARYSLTKKGRYLIKDGEMFIRGKGVYKNPDKKVKFSNYIVAYYNYAYRNDNPTLFYDTENRRFLQGLGVDYRKGKVITTIPYTQKDKKFDYDNTGKNLIYMTSSGSLDKENGSAFAILKDPDKAEYYLAIFSLKDYNQIYYEKIDAIDLDKATHYAVSPQFGYLFYSVGSKVYQYDYTLPASSPNKNKIMLDKGAEEITLLKFQHFFNLKNKIKYYNDMSEQLIVCSYDPSKPEGSNGTMETYTVPALNGKIVLKDKFTGFGKIKSVGFKEKVVR